MMKVRKRDGRYADFDAGRIRKAVNAARCEVKSDDLFLLDIVVNDVVSRCHDGISVEEIQDLVEGSLMAYGKPEVAKAYILYRDKRTKARSSASDQIIADIIAAKKNDVTRENANMNTDTPAGMMMKIASERSKEHVVNYLLSQDTLDLMSANILHVHDMDYYPTRSLTCVQSPVDKLLNGGFKAGHGESRPAKRIETASILACISLETTQNEQHGGQAIPAFDFYLAPFVRLTYIEEVKKAESLLGRKYESLYHKDIPDYITKEEPLDCKSPSEENVMAWAINQTVCRVHQAMEAFIHNMNTIHSRGGNQVVFSSLNYGTDTSAEGRCIIRELLKCTYQGVGNGSTAIFPIQIWKKKRGVNYLPGDPNYDLFQLACKVTAKRFFPNFLNLDATFNRSKEWKADDPKRYEHEVATMGCVDGQEVVTWRIEGKVYVSSISRFWKQMEKHNTVHSASKEGFNDGEFINLNGVEIQDSNNFVECLRVIKNPDKGDWMKVTLSNGRVLTVTSDHPWTVNNEVVLTKDLKIGDSIALTTVQLVGSSHFNVNEDMAWLIGFILCDGCYDGQMMSTIGLDEKDIRDKYCHVFLNSVHSRTIVREQHRAKKGDYYELKNYDYGEGRISKFRRRLISEFGGVKKIDRQIPSWVFNAPTPIRASFLAGMMDADGYINANRDRAKCQIGSINKALAIQTMLLAQSLGVPAKMYENHYCSSRPSAVRYRIEFDAFSELTKHMVSAKKKAKYTSSHTPIPFEFGEVTKIEHLGFRDRCSYDVTTSSEHFTVSGVRSHNCRTRIFEDRFGRKTSIGRGNLSFSTINLPGLALSVMDKPEAERIEQFFDKLKNAIDITGKQLNERYEFQCTALVKQFPLLMSGMWMESENLKPNDEVREVLKHGSLGVGFIGLAECLIALCGHHHGESEEAQKLGLRIIGFMKERVAELSDKYDLNYSVFATPAEGLSGKFTKKDRAKYGIVKGVTDKDYYTNSNHVPVYYHCSADHKAKVEAPYHELTRGGHIFYVEMDGDATHNVEAIHDIVRLVDKYDIGYASVNHNRNRCLDCGYEDASKDLETCPECGSHRIDKLQRITGYLVGTTDRWNSGKLAELKDRVTHD
jgi:anaerobic ribonucleoside-triphosphate reductase